MVSIIVAISKNRVIGHNGRLPWHLPSDLKRFKDLTLGNPVIMGRKTYESLPEKFRPLPGRANIVVSQSGQLERKKITVVSSLEEAVTLVTGCRQAFIIGGESIFRQALVTNIVRCLYLTRVEVECEGDAFFPEFENAGWSLTERLQMIQGEKDEHPMFFSIYKRS